jgi:hypothetical protein
LFKYKYLRSLGVRKESCWAIIGERNAVLYDECVAWWNTGQMST